MTLRVVADSKVGHSEFDIVGGGTHVGDYFPIRIQGGAVTRFRLAWDGWFRSGGTEQSMSNGYTTRGNVQVGSTVVPFTFSGARDGTITAGAVDVQSDWINAADLGFSGPIPADTILYCKTDRTPTSGTKTLENNFEAGSGGGQGYPYSVSAHYNPSTGSLGPLDAAGGFVGSGSGVSLFGIGYRPHVLGEYATTGKAAGVIIDSIADTGTGSYEHVGIGAAGADDGSPTQGSFARVGCKTLGIPLFNLAKNSGTASTHTKTAHYFAYFDFLIDELGANDLFDGLAAAQARELDLWSLARSAGVQRIIRTKVFPRTTFDGSGNQTYQSSQFAPGGDADTFNTWMLSKLADGTIDAVLPLAAIRLSSDPFKWLSQAVTVDGTHTTASGAGPAGTELSNYLGPIISGAPAPTPSPAPSPAPTPAPTPTPAAPASAPVVAMFDAVIEADYTAGELLSMFAALFAGKSSGQFTASPSFRNVSDTKTTVAALLDTRRNRVAVTLN